MASRKKSDQPSGVEDPEGQAVAAAALEQLQIDREVLTNLLPAELQHLALPDR